MIFIPQICLAPVAGAQSLISGDIVGRVLDPNGEAIPGAKLRATNEETGAVTIASASTSGEYRFSLLKPGKYQLTVSAAGFKTGTARISVAVGQIVTQDISLALGAASQNIEVKTSGQLLQTSTPVVSTELNLEQLRNIPNPGNDVTYEAQAKPGVVMNTGANSATGLLGYGNFSVYGLPGASNNFTVNGMQENDPFLNLNFSGPSNLLLGVNDLQETDVVTNAYDASYGNFAGVQLNSISRSGTDKFHGNLLWAWNGSAMNGNDWFNKNPFYNSPATARPFSNFNQWAAAIGGPIKKDKLFFFFNTEGISFITSSENVVYLPDDSFEAGVLGADGKCDDASSSLFNSGVASQCAFYNRIFALYNGTPNRSAAVESTGDPGALQLAVPARFRMTERMITARLDANLSDTDKMFVHFKYDHGVQPTYTDPINSAFDGESDQPDYEGQFAETHLIGTRAVNQLLVAGSYLSFIYKDVNPALDLGTFPMDLRWYDSFASDLNNLAYEFPSGRNITQYQITDDFSTTLGRHTLKAGAAYKKDDISDFDTGELNVPLIYTDQAYGDFQSGQALFGIQTFPTHLGLPLSLYNFGLYFQDDWKPIGNATVTAGVRLERNSNVSCRKNCLSNFGGDFFAQAASTPLGSASGAYNAQIKSGLPDAFMSYQRFMVEPRIGFSWSMDPKTVLRGGFGVFAEMLPATIADAMLLNPPLTTEFTVYGATNSTSAVTFPTVLLDPSDPTSAQSRAASANAAFQSGFKTGGSFASECAANANLCYSPPSFTTVASSLHYPTYYEWNLQLQRQLGRFDSLQLGYVGNRGYHEPNQNIGVNAAGGFGLPATQPAPSFGPVNEFESEAESDYNGLLITWLHQGHGLTSQLTYTWSHALDEISNGGILPFNAASIEGQINPHDLKQNRGNSDYDVPQYFSGNYLYQLPRFRGPRLLMAGWQAGGTIYYNSGSPFTPEAYISDFKITNDGGGTTAVPIAPLAGTPHHCTAKNANPSTPCFTKADFSFTTPFGATERNQFWGPHFFDTDMTLLKGFDLRRAGETVKFEAGLTAFNLFNHPSFGLPNPSSDSSHFGLSLYAEGPPTSIYGSGVGGDPSVRIVEFTGRMIF